MPQMLIELTRQISPILGPPLMFIFICLTNILLITSLISILSNSLTKVRTVLDVLHLCSNYGRLGHHSPARYAAREGGANDWTRSANFLNIAGHPARTRRVSIRVSRHASRQSWLNRMFILQVTNSVSLFSYSVFVLEASTSNRLTYFVPPLVSLTESARPPENLCNATMPYSIIDEDMADAKA